MKVEEYDATRDVLYLWLASPGTTAASTTVVSPGIHADVDQEGTMIGLEVLDASRQACPDRCRGRRDNVQFEVELDLPKQTTAGST